MGSNPTGPTITELIMAFVYMLKGQNGRHYLGATEDLEARIKRHQSGMVHSTRRLGLPLDLIAFREYPVMSEALAIEKMLKGWKNPTKARLFLEQG
ncbi:MAG TPA: GIY-YIG nuclease family protein [Luteolibacter sp.]|nr:GIY-YIG nuclease family protein [Luteolibacter sp.]